MSKLCLFFVLFILLSFSRLSIVQADDVLSAPEVKPWIGDFAEMKKRRMIRILVPYSKSIYFIDKGRQYGTAAELGEALEAWLNVGKKNELEKVHVAFIPTPREELFNRLIQGYGDIVAGNLTVTPKRLEVVDFTDPYFRGAKEVLVMAPTAPTINTIRDLAGKKIFVRRSSSYWTHLQELNQSFVADGREPIDVQPIDENLEDEDLLEMVNAGLLQWCVVDNHIANIWSRVFKNVKIRHDIVFSDNGDIAWAIRKNSPQLKAELNKFVKTHRLGTKFGNILANRYMRDEKMLRKASAPAELNKFNYMLALFAKHGATYNFDEVLLAAQGYQESQLDQSRRSPRGAVGVMQLLPTTAADKAVNIKGIEKSEDRNIEAGAKYLRHLTDVYIKGGRDDLNRTLFALAAYNAGPGKFKQFREKAQKMGLDTDVWFGNVENGAAKIVGRETVQYVGNIFKYYIAYSMYLKQEEAKAEAKVKVGE